MLCRQRAIKPRGEPSPPLGKPEAADSSPGGSPLAPRSARRSADRPPRVAASDPRLCPESRQVPQSLTEETAAARTACTSHCDRQHRARPLTTNVATTSGNAAPPRSDDVTSEIVVCARPNEAARQVTGAAHIPPEIAAILKPAPTDFPASRSLAFNLQLQPGH